MLAHIRRWPPVLWLVVYIGSLFVIEAANRVWVSVIGIALIAIAFATSVWLALSDRPGDPRPRFVAGALAAVGAFYLAVGAAAALAGWEYGVAGLLAGAIPGTAVAIMLTATRSRTGVAQGRLVDRSTDDDDETPAQGFDEQTPLGSTSEHSTAEADPAAAARARRAAAQAGPSVGGRQRHGAA